MEFLSKPILVAAVLLLISIVVRLILTHKLRKKKYHPIAGTVFHQLLNFHRLHDYMTDLARKHKTYKLLGPFRDEVYTSDPPNVEYMLRTNFENFGKVSCLFPFSPSFLGCKLKSLIGHCVYLGIKLFFLARKVKLQIMEGVFTMKLSSLKILI